MCIEKDYDVACPHSARLFKQENILMIGLDDNKYELSLQKIFAVYETFPSKSYESRVRNPGRVCSGP